MYDKYRHASQTNCLYDTIYNTIIISTVQRNASPTKYGKFAVNTVHAFALVLHVTLFMKANDIR